MSTNQQPRIVGRLKPLPLREVIAIARNEIRIRLGRSLLTMASIFLGITFLVSTFTVSLVNDRIKHEKAVRTGQTVSAEASTVEKQKLIWLVTIALVLSTMGITNTMLMTVTERFREIGTMKCMGALNRSIALIFLIESLLLGAIGTAAGVLMGAILALLGLMTKHGISATFHNFPIQTELIGCGIALSIGLFLSILGSIVPAYRAIKMTPADAMRTEV